MILTDQFGNTTFDSSSQGGVFVQFAVFPPNQSGTITLPGYLFNMQISVVPLQSGNHSYGLETLATTGGSGIKRIYYNHIVYPDWQNAGATLPSSLNVPTVLMVLAK